MAPERNLCPRGELAGHALAVAQAPPRHLLELGVSRVDHQRQDRPENSEGYAPRREPHRPEQDEPAHALRSDDGAVQRDPSAHRSCDYVASPDAKLRGDVIEPGAVVAAGLRIPVVIV